MIYAMPRNDAVMSLLPANPTPDQLDKFLARLTQGLTNAGYVLGPSGVFWGPFGEIMVDADRDPSAQWSTFTPPTQTTQEAKATTDLNRVLQALPSLRAGSLNLANTQAAIAWLVEKELTRMGVPIP